MKIIGFVKKCTGVSRWGWFETDQRFNIRKPLWIYPELMPGQVNNHIADGFRYNNLEVPEDSRSLWARIKDWFINLFK